MAGVVAQIKIGTNEYDVYAFTTNPVADANAYLAAHNNADAWFALDTTARKKLVVSAFRFLDRQKWSGSELVDGQSTKWPRTGATCDGETLPDGIPNEIVQAEFELALMLVSNPGLVDSKSTHSDVKSVKAGSASVEFFIAPRGAASRFPTVIDELVGCMLAGATNSAGLTFVSGVDEDSVFSADDFDRDEPLA